MAAVIIITMCLSLGAGLGVLTTLSEYVVTGRQTRGVTATTQHVSEVTAS